MTFSPVLLTLLTLLVLLNPHLTRAVVDDEPQVEIDACWPAKFGRGGVRMRITGDNFAGDSFAFGAAGLGKGNDVWLASTSGIASARTDVFIDGSSKTITLADTPVLPPGTQNVRMTVDEKDVPEDVTCEVTVEDELTPQIWSLTKKDYAPNDLVEIYGKVFTDRIETSSPTASNGKTELIQGVTARVKDPCELKDTDNNEIYGTSLTSGDVGSVTCKLNSPVGNVNITVHISEPYGKSIGSESAYCVMCNDEIAMLQIYPVIESLSVSSIAPMGGGVMEINGKFGTELADVTATMAGTECDVIDKSPSKITLRVVGEPATSATYKGGSGVMAFLLPDNGETFDEIRMADTSAVTAMLLRDMSGVGNTQVKEHAGFIRMEAFLTLTPGDYKLLLESTDDSAVYLDLDGDISALTQVSFSSREFRGFMFESDDITVVAGQMPVMTYIVRKAANMDVLRLGLYQLQTVLSAMSVSDKVLADTTILRVNSPQVPDQQLVEVAVTVQDAVHAVRQVAVPDGFPDFRICYRTVCSYMMSSSVSAEDMQQIINKMPSIPGECARVTREEAGGVYTFTITCESEIGDLDEFTFVDAESGSDLGPEVTMVTTGLPSGNMFSLGFGSSVSAPMPNDVTAEQMQAVLEQMHSVQLIDCSLPNNALVLDYEDNEDEEDDDHYVHWSSRRSDVVPFSGKTCLRNVVWLYWRDRGYNDAPAVNLLEHKYICFAYKGPLQQNLWIQFDYSLQSATPADYFPPKGLTISTDNLVPTTDWDFVCVDVLTPIREWRTDLSYANLIRARIYVEPLLVNNYLYIDYLVFTTSEPHDKKGLVGNRYVPERWVSNGITVTGNHTVGFTVTMSVHHCAVDLPLYDIYGNLNAASLVTRTMTSSPPVGGDFTLAFNGWESTVSAAYSDGAVAGRIANHLETVPGVGLTHVDCVGDCSGYVCTISLISAPGNQPPITVAATNLEPTDATAEIRADETIDGGILRDWFPGCMCRIRHTIPQLNVEVNNRTAMCPGGCNFDWNAAQSTLTSITPDTGTVGTVVTLVGTEFSSVMTENVVMTGDVPCDVTSASVTEIVCTVGEGTGGELAVTVVTPAGLADGAVTFTYNVQLASIDPPSGGIGGFNVLTLAGSSLGDGFSVAVGDNDCPILSSSNDVMTCTLPAATSAVDVAVDVTVSKGSVSAVLSAAYTYTAGPLITSATPDTFSPFAGEEVTLAGSDFGDSEPEVNKVMIGDLEMSITSWADTMIVISTTDLPPGTHILKVIKTDTLIATTSVSVEFEVRDVEPSSGSMMGGTTFTIKTSGLPTDCSLIHVLIGDVPCVVNVDTCTPTQLTCITPPCGDVHVITPDVINVGDEWKLKPESLEVRKGDTVVFYWSAPRYTNSMFSVLETMSVDSMDLKPGGHDSGPPRPAVSSSLAASEVGTWYYYSKVEATEVDVASYYTVKVNDWQRTLKDVHVMYNEHHATHNMASGESIDDDGLSCKGTDTHFTACTEGDLDDQTSGTYFTYEYQPCKSPTITAISAITGICGDTITFTGTGLSDDICEYEILFGDQSCTVTTASSTEVQCTLSCTDMVPYVPHKIRVRVLNLGEVIYEGIPTVGQYFTLYANIATFGPTAMSLNGGATVTATGNGFTTATMVKWGDTLLEPLSLTYTEITFKAPAGSGTVAVGVYVGDQQALCSQCELVYSSASTPVLDDVTHTIDALDQTVTFAGSNLGTTLGDIEMWLGNSPCTPLSVSDTSIDCNAGSPYVGPHDVILFRAGVGNATSSASVHVSHVLHTASTPLHGSLCGHTKLVLCPLGYDIDDIQITVDGEGCIDIEPHPLRDSCVTCYTPPYKDMSTSGDYPVDVITVSSSYTYTPTETFIYDNSRTPTVSSVAPSSGVAGDTITIAGSGLSVTASDMSVTAGDVACVVATSDVDELTCVLGPHPAQSVPIIVNYARDGNACGELTFTYILKVDSLTPDFGSFGGGQPVDVAGAGFGEDTMVTVCGVECEIVADSLTTSGFKFITPGQALDGTSDKLCTVSVWVGDGSADMRDDVTDGYTYSYAHTPLISSLTPDRGGTGGGTEVALTGSNLDLVAASDISVSIDGTDSVVQSVAEDQIMFLTGARLTSVKASPSVLYTPHGLALHTTDVKFEYANYWSSKSTWGGRDPPTKGETVIIPKGQQVVLDTSTPVLNLIYIEGELVAYNENCFDFVFRARYIIINNGGRLQVGTADSPYSSCKAEFEIHGDVRSTELPIFGSKVIGVRHGCLEMYGERFDCTWTHLQEDALIGATSITVGACAADWPATTDFDVLIVIASTGGPNNTRETEERYITSKTVNDDGSVELGLDQPLEYYHSGHVETCYGETLDKRGEVGLLYRTVNVRGTMNEALDELVAQTAPDISIDDQNSDQFAQSVVFLGPVGSTHGVQINYSPDHNMLDESCMKLVSISVSHAGQANRLGRYPVHMHLAKDQSNSCIIDNAIYNTFNRAINLHDTSDTVVCDNVVYNVSGGAIFLEDGSEVRNEICRNLVLYIRVATSLLNDDNTPAAFWITNPDNIVVHNAAASGSHFGFWLRMHVHPDGPSFNPDVWPQKTVLGQFYGNVAHTFGQYGFWVFQEYYPTEDSGQTGSNTPHMAVFKDCTSYNNVKGMEMGQFGSVCWDGFKTFGNTKVGVDLKEVILNDEFTLDDRPCIVNSVIGGWCAEPDTYPTGAYIPPSTSIGLYLPLADGFYLDNVHFMNVKAAYGYPDITGKLESHFGGFSSELSNMEYSSIREGVMHYRWEHEGRVTDKDGTTTGSTPASTVIPCCELYHPVLCTHSIEMTGSAVKACICDPSVVFKRMGINDLKDDLKFKNALVKNEHGSATIFYEEKRLTHPNGFTMILEIGPIYTWLLGDGLPQGKLKQSGSVQQLEGGESVVLCNVLESKPDLVQIVKEQGFEEASDTLENLGDYNYNEETGKLCYLVKAPDSSSRKKRSTGGATTGQNVDVDVESYSCEAEGGCVTGDAVGLEVIDGRPANNVRCLTGSVLEELKQGDCLIIPDDDNYYVLDETLPPCKAVIVHGRLEVGASCSDALQNVDVEIHAGSITVMGTGSMMIGWPDDPHTAHVLINLTGQRGDGPPTDCDTSLPDTVHQAPKSFNVYGAVDIFGALSHPSWTTLHDSAMSGDKQITLTESVNWKVGDQFAIAPGGFEPDEAEVRTITAVSDNGQTIDFERELQYDHKVTVTEACDGDVTFAPEVGHLTRHVVITGEDSSDTFGAFMRVAAYENEVGTYKGRARVSGVAFGLTGQEGYKEKDDPRYAFTFNHNAIVSDTAPSSLVGCSFHHSFTPAIALFSVTRMTVSDNFIYRTIGAGVRVEGFDNVLEHNLVLRSENPSTYEGRGNTVSADFLYHPAFDVEEAVGVVLTNNVAGGADNVGFRINGIQCSDQLTWAGNVAHSSFIGVAIIQRGHQRCTRIQGFTVWKAYDFGVYAQCESSVEVNNVVLSDCGVGVFGFIYKPSILTHEYDYKHMTVSDSTIIGSSGTECTEPVDKTKTNFQYTKTGRSFRAVDDEGRVGVCSTTFNSNKNKPLLKGFMKLKAYNAERGATFIKNNCIAGFNSECEKNRILALSPSNEDAHFEVRFSENRYHNVDEANRLYYCDPDLGKLNEADCVDMTCEGKREVVTKLDDEPQLYAVSRSEYLYNKAESGMGDYRIPPTALFSVDGQTIPPPVNKGIYRGVDNCEWMIEWNAYKCRGIDYTTLVIASLDSDTETRRLSPISLMTGNDDGGSTGWVDLLNGPQDHGWCFGYTCRKRVSTFMAVVGEGRKYEVHMTSTCPQHTRFVLLNAPASSAVAICLHYRSPHVIRVFADQHYILGKNSILDSNGQPVLRPLTDTSQFHLDVDREEGGVNYFIKDENTICFIVRGADVIDVKIDANQVRLGFFMSPASLDEFYIEHVVRNIASLLDIPESTIRVVNIVSELSQRKKRAADPVQLVLEIANPPSYDGLPADIPRDDLIKMASTVYDAYQLGTLGTLLNVTILSLEVTEPLPEPGSDEWVTYTDNEDQGVPNVVPILKPAFMEVKQEAVGLTDGNPLSVHPIIYLKDTKGQRISQLGSTAFPWKVTASLQKVAGSSLSASLTGDVTVTYNGGATFTNLIISHSGTYKLLYRVSEPADASYSVMSGDVTVGVRDVRASILSQHVTATVGHKFSVRAELIDGDTGKKIQNINWRGHSWRCQVRHHLSDLTSGQIQGLTTVDVDDSSGIARFDDLVATQPGLYFMELEFTSSPAEYNFKITSDAVEVLPVNYTSPVVEVRSEVRISFNLDYTSTLNVTNGVTYFTTGVRNVVLISINTLNVTVSQVVLTEGSILATFVMEGTNRSMVTALEDLYYVVATGAFSFQFFGTEVTADGRMWVDGEEFYRALPTASGLSTGELAAIIVCSSVVVVIIIVVIIVLVVMQTNKKGKGSLSSLAHITGSASPSTPSSTPGFHGLSGGMKTPEWKTPTPNPATPTPPATLGAPATHATRATPGVGGEPGYHSPPRHDSAMTGHDSAMTGHDSAITGYSGFNPREDASLRRRESEITLQLDEGTRSPPVPEFDDEGDDVPIDDEMTTGRETSRSQQSRPPSTPSTVWSVDGGKKKK